jgi:CheY-like chemotaxis protein
MNDNKVFLIVDDDEVFLFTASYALKKRYPEVNILMARNGKEGLHMLKENRLDALFLDINMPVMNGWEMLDELAQSENGIDFPIMMVSSSIDPSDKQKASEYRFKPLFVEKPLSEDKVRSLNL